MSWNSSTSRWAKASGRQRFAPRPLPAPRSSRSSKSSSAQLPQPLSHSVGTGLFRAGLDPPGHAVFPAGDRLQQFPGRALVPGLPQHLAAKSWRSVMRRPAAGIAPAAARHEGMEGADVHRLWPPAAPPGAAVQPLAHLFRRLVGEGHRRDLLRAWPPAPPGGRCGPPGSWSCPCPARPPPPPPAPRRFHSRGAGPGSVLDPRPRPIAFCLRAPTGLALALPAWPCGAAGGRRAKQGHLAR